MHQKQPLYDPRAAFNVHSQLFAPDVGKNYSPTSGRTSPNSGRGKACSGSHGLCGPTPRTSAIVGRAASCRRRRHAVRGWTGGGTGLAAGLRSRRRTTSTSPSTSTLRGSGSNSSAPRGGGGGYRTGQIMPIIGMTTIGWSARVYGMVGHLPSSLPVRTRALRPTWGRDASVT